MSDISGDTIPESLQVTPPTPHERIASALERIADVLEWQAEATDDGPPPVFGGEPSPALEA